MQRYINELKKLDCSKTNEQIGSNQWLSKQKSIYSDIIIKFINSRTTKIPSHSEMQIQSHKISHSPILQFTNASRTIKQNSETYFNKHWQVIQTSIKFFVLQRASVNLVAFRKSLQLLVLNQRSSQIKQALVTLWKQVWGQVLKSIQVTQSNPLIALIENYKIIEDRLKIVFTFLRSYLDNSARKQPDYIDQFGKHIVHHRPNSQTDAYNILCQLILQSPQCELYERQMILLIEAFRNSTYSSQNIISEDLCKNQVRIDLLILKKIGIFRHLQKEFDQTSKEFYVQLSQEIPKNDSFLQLVNGYLEREIDLNKIFEPKINTVYYVEKQLIREYFDYVLDNLLEPMITNKNIRSLKILWNFTLRLKDQALKQLSQKLKQIIQGVKKYFVNNTKKKNIFKLIQFRENLFTLTEECFEKNRKIFNLIYNTFEEVLYEEEKHYLNTSLKNILQEHLNLDQSRIDQQSTTAIQQQQGFQKSSYFKLFRIAPSKENFIREYEARFAKWILNCGFQVKSLKMQEKMVQQMKKQVGNNLMKRLDRMLNDVYRNGQMHYYQQTMSNNTLMKCMFLSSNWPVHLSIVFNIPDELYNMQNQFETQFRKSIENKEKSVKWVSQMGTLTMAINGVESVVSQLQAAIIMVLDKSIRPLKKEQIQASLNICNMNQSASNFSTQKYLSDILSNLLKNNILEFNPNSQTYDINENNKNSYKFERQNEQTETQTIKKGDGERDNNILIEAAIVKILKKRKNMQRSDITRFIEETIKRFKPTFEQITKAFEKLHNSNYIEINREKGIISYLQ